MMKKGQSKMKKSQSKMKKGQSKMKKSQSKMKKGQSNAYKFHFKFNFDIMIVSITNIIVFILEFKKLRMCKNNAFANQNWQTLTSQKVLEKFIILHILIQNYEDLTTIM
jgi:hypothetical protein